MKILLTLFVLLFSSSVVAEYGDVYFCNTIQISELSEDQVKSNFKPITFKFSMERKTSDNDDDLGTIRFSDEVIGTIADIYDFLPILLIDTHVKPEQFMASVGTTKAWFLDGTLSLSSIFKREDSQVSRIITSISKCDKF